MVTRKAWGFEKQLVNTELYCCKVLTVTGGKICSLHRHLVKDETFVCLEGSGYIEVEGHLARVQPFSELRIPPGTWHRFGSRDGMRLLEVSTHHDDEDVERKTVSGDLPEAIARLE